MIDFYYAPTPNGWKVAIMLEECGLPYRTILMDLTKGDQFDKDFLTISPNARIPAIVDNDTGGDPVPVFESGAILLYLAEKTDRFGWKQPKPDKELYEWLFWQAANLGPMAGQLSFFLNYASERTNYVLARYSGEYERCLAVLDTRLMQRDYILGDYTIVDMMIFPWVFIAKNFGIDLVEFPSVADWRNRIKQRPAVRRAIDLHKDTQFTGAANADNAPRLFRQTAREFKP